MRFKCLICDSLALVDIVASSPNEYCKLTLYAAGATSFYSFVCFRTKTRFLAYKINVKYVSGR